MQKKKKKKRSLALFCSSYLPSAARLAPHGQIAGSPRMGLFGGFLSAATQLSLVYFFFIFPPLSARLCALCCLASASALGVASCGKAPISSTAHVACLGIFASIDSLPRRVGGIQPPAGISLFNFLTHHLRPPGTIAWNPQPHVFDNSCQTPMALGHRFCPAIQLLGAGFAWDRTKAANMIVRILRSFSAYQ